MFLRRAIYCSRDNTDIISALEETYGEIEEIGYKEFDECSISYFVDKEFNEANFIVRYNDEYKDENLYAAIRECASELGFTPIYEGNMSVAIVCALQCKNLDSSEDYARLLIKWCQRDRVVSYCVLCIVPKDGTLITNIRIVNMMTGKPTSMGTNKWYITFINGYVFDPINGYFGFTMKSYFTMLCKCMWAGFGLAGYHEDATPEFLNVVSQNLSEAYTEVLGRPIRPNGGVYL